MSKFSSKLLFILSTFLFLSISVSAQSLEDYNGKYACSFGYLQHDEHYASHDTFRQGASIVIINNGDVDTYYRDKRAGTAPFKNEFFGNVSFEITNSYTRSIKDYLKVFRISLGKYKSISFAEDGRISTNVGKVGQDFYSCTPCDKKEMSKVRRNLCRKNI